MLKEGLGDKVFNEVNKRTNQVLGVLKDEARHQKPFRKELIKPIDRLYMFDTMPEEQINAFVSQNGLQAWMDTISEMDTIRRRYK